MVKKDALSVYQRIKKAPPNNLEGLLALEVQV